MSAESNLADLASAKWLRLAELVQLGQADPIRASESLREIQGLMGDLATLGYPVSPRSGCARVFRAGPIGAVPALSQSNESPSIRFAQAGVVLAMYGSTLPVTGVSAADSMRSIEVNFRWNGGDKSFVSNGESADFAQFQALFTDQSPWFPLQLFVRGSDTTWTVQFRNNHPTEAITPSLYFSFLPAPPAMVEQLARMWGYP